MIRSDGSEAHRLSLSARVLSAEDRQVKRNNKVRSASAACGISILPVPVRRPRAGAQPGHLGSNPVFYPGIIWHFHFHKLYDVNEKCHRFSFLRPTPVDEQRPSILVIIVIVRLVGRFVRLAALIVPKLPIHAVCSKQLGMRAALDRLAA